MVRDKIATYTRAESEAKVKTSARNMHDCIREIESKYDDGDVKNVMSIITEIWNSDLSDYDAAQMVCAIGMHVMRSGMYDEFEEEYAPKAEENMSALKEKWGME